MNSHAVKELLRQLPERKKPIFDEEEYQRVKSQMSPETLEELKRIGEQMYSQDYTKPNDELFETSAAWILSGLRSGLQVKDLRFEEIAVLNDKLGESWSLTYGVSKEELQEVFDEKRKESDLGRDS